MCAITHVYAGVPVSDLDVGIDWYTRFFGRPNGVRQAQIPDPDGNRIAFAELPDA